MGIFGSRSDGKGGAGAGIRSPFVAEGRTERPQNPTVLPWQRPHEPNLCALRKQRWRRARGPPRPHGAAPPGPPVPLGQCGAEVSTLFTLISRRALREISPLRY